MNNIKYYTLKNNLNIIHTQKSTFNNVSIMVKIKAGSNYENQNNIGVAHLLEHLIINHNHYIISNYGAKVNAITTRDFCIIEVKILEHFIEQALKYIAQIFLDNNFVDSQVLTQKQIIKHEINLYKNSTQKILLQNTYKNLYPKSRMTILNTGEENHIDKVSLNDLINFKNNFYTTQNTVISIISNLDNNIIIHLLQKHLEKITDNSIKIIDPIFNICEKPKYMVIGKNDNNLNIKIDFAGETLNSNFKYNLKILSNLVNNHLVYKLKNQYHLVYNLNVQNYSSLNYGIFSIYTVSTDEQIINKIMNEINNISQNNFYQAKISVLSDFLYNLDNNFELNNFYTDQIYLDKPKSIDQEIKEYKDVTFDDIQNTMKYVFSQNPKVTVFG